MLFNAMNKPTKDNNTYNFADIQKENKPKVYKLILTQNFILALKFIIYSF